MNKLNLKEQEIQEIDELLGSLTQKFKTVEDPEFVNQANLLAHELPLRVKQELHKFRLLEEGDGVMVVSGLPVDDEAIGNTPSHWATRPEVSPALREEMFFVLAGSILGETIGWATQQDGFLMHDILPIKEHEDEQLGFGSSTDLEWHTEDAFHPYRADYIGLMCLRNPTNVPTTTGSINQINLEKEKMGMLFEPHFTIRPDESHLEKNRVKAHDNNAEVLTDSYDKINKMNTAPDQIPVLFGDFDRPYVRLDPYFMEPPSDERAKQSLDDFIEEMNRNMTGVVLQPGDVLFVDNFRVVHGRPSYKPRYDGKDRWLKRINIARDLRKSRSSRRRSDCRIIH